MGVDSEWLVLRLSEHPQAMVSRVAEQLIIPRSPTVPRGTLAWEELGGRRFCSTDRRGRSSPACIPSPRNLMLPITARRALLPCLVCMAAVSQPAQGQLQDSSRNAHLRVIPQIGIALPAGGETYGVEVALASALPISASGRVAYWGLGGDCIQIGPCFPEGWSWEVGGTYQRVSETPVQPILGATVGQMHMTDTFRDERHQYRMWTAQGGADFALTPRVALRTTLRYGVLPNAPRFGPLAAGVVGIRWSSPSLW